MEINSHREIQRHSNDIIQKEQLIDDMSELLEQVLVANICLQPVQFTMTILANGLNIRILCSRALRSSPCTFYFLAYALFNIVYASSICPTQFLRSFDIDWANTKFGCKLHYYILFTIPHQANIMLVLASFDRYFSSSKSRQLHLKSSLRIARISILIGSLIPTLYMSPMLIIYSFDSISNKCLPQSNLVILIYTSAQLTIFYLITPLIMFILGLLTIRNIRRPSTGCQPVVSSWRTRRREGELTRMLILQFTVHLILILPFGIIYGLNFFVPSTRTPMIRAIRFVFVLWQQCDYFVSFFLYVLSGNIYRRELIRILKFNRRRPNHLRTFVLDRKNSDRKLPLLTIILPPTDAVAI